MTTTPRRSLPNYATRDRNLADAMAGIDRGTIRPRRPAPRRAAQCRDYFQHSDCGDNGLHVRGEWMAELDEYGDTPRHAEDAPCAA